MLEILKTYTEEKIQILSINPIDMKGKVESDAKTFKLPYPVLVGRDSKIAEMYKVKSLPCLVIAGKEGNVLFYAKFAKAEEMKKILETLIR